MWFLQFNFIRQILILTVFIVFAFAVPVNAEPKKAELETFKSGLEASNLLSMDVTNLREASCGGEGTEGGQDAKNAKFIGCVMYVLGVVDMLREWQKIDPTHALPVCVPRNVTSGALIIAVQAYIETTAPWHNQQLDATTAVIGAVRAKWPCVKP